MRLDCTINYIAYRTEYAYRINSGTTKFLPLFQRAHIFLQNNILPPFYLLVSLLARHLTTVQLGHLPIANRPNSWIKKKILTERFRHRIFFLAGRQHSPLPKLANCFYVVASFLLPAIANSFSYIREREVIKYEECYVSNIIIGFTRVCNSRANCCRACRETTTQSDFLRMSK